MFKIPTQTTAGEYLLRVDAPWVTGLTWNRWDPADKINRSQLYPSCVQILVKSNATGPLPPGVRIPEDMSAESPGTSVLFLSSVSILLM